MKRKFWTDSYHVDGDWPSVNLHDTYNEAMEAAVKTLKETDELEQELRGMDQVKVCNDQVTIMVYPCYYEDSSGTDPTKIFLCNLF